MGIRSDIQTDIAAAFDTDLSDAVSALEGVFTQSSGEYDPVTGTYTTITTTYRGRGVLGGFRTFEIDGVRILATDYEITALQNELLIVENGVTTDSPVVPRVDDVINGMAVIDVQQDPANAAWSLQCRGTPTPVTPISPYVLLVDSTGVVLTDANGNTLAIEAA